METRIGDREAQGVSVNLKKEKQDQRRAAECCGEESCLRDGVNFI